jgi:hypothetical protein
VPALVGPVAVVAAALVVSGAFKLADPGPSGDMLAALRLPRSPWAGRALGLGEVLLGGTTLAVGGWAAGAVAALYLGFAAVMARLVLLGDEAPSCGCFGRLSARPTWVHVAADAGAALVAGVGAAQGVPGLVEALGEPPLAGLPLLGFVGLGTWALVAVLTLLPDTLAAVRHAPPSGGEVRTFHLVDRPDPSGAP